MYLVKDPERITAVSEVFKALGLEKIRKFELLDPQMRVAEKIASACGETAAVLLAVNAVVSYMIPFKGEEYWRLFGEFVVRECPDTYREIVRVIEEFTKRHNRLYLDAKLKRIKKLATCRELAHMVTGGDLSKYWRTLAACLDSKPDSKTVVFSVKMAYYGLAALGKGPALPKDAPIPVDRRVAIITVTSGMIKPQGRRITDYAVMRQLSVVLLRKARLVKEVWRTVSEYSDIPQLHLDAPVWVIGGYASAGSKSVVLEMMERDGIADAVGREELWQLIHELLHELPP